MASYNSILETIGRTPLVRLNRLAPEGVNVFVKLESFNPMGSVKDRMALAVIEAAERSGELRPGQTVVEATSGNTGIGLAMVCAQKGYPLVVVMAENFSVERRKLLRYLGAKVVLTPAAEKGTGMLRKAEELAERHGWFLCHQFENQANADVHVHTTAKEILHDLEGKKLDYFVCGYGTGGTLQGTGRGLKSDDPRTRIAVVEPDNSQLIGSGVAQARHGDGSPNGSHPNFRPHPVQGVTPDFISALTNTALQLNLVDQTIPVAGQDAIDMARAIARQEGIFVGISSGAILAATLQLASRVEAGTNIVCLLPDTGERYLSTPLFADVGEDMSRDELLLSQSTPGCQFAPISPSISHAPALASVSPTPVKTAPVAQTKTWDKQAEAFVDAYINSQNIAFFALEWCEFCWSVRKLFTALEINFSSVDIDAVKFQVENRGLRIRKVLTDKYQLPTIPQIFIGGRRMGGASDVFEAAVNGELFAALNAAGIAYRRDLTIDPAAFLPNWVHPRKRA